MRIIFRFVVFVITLVGVIAILIGGIFLGTGNLDFLERIGIEPRLGDVQITTDSAPNTQEITETVGSATVLRFTWRGDEIVYNDSVISETDFADLLAQAKASESKVEVVKFSDVRVEAADRWRELLDGAGVRYEIIPQE
jgi:hypothetical protein